MIKNSWNVTTKHSLGTFCHVISDNSSSSAILSARRHYSNTSSKLAWSGLSSSCGHCWSQTKKTHYIWRAKGPTKNLTFKIHSPKLTLAPLLPVLDLFCLMGLEQSLSVQIIYCTFCIFRILFGLTLIQFFWGPRGPRAEQNGCFT